MPDGSGAVQKAPPTVKAYVLADGQVVSGTYFDRYAVKNHDTESRQLPPDGFADQYDRRNLIRPPYNLEALGRLLEVNTYHRRATTTKAGDTVGRGWRLVAHEGVEEPDESQRARAKEFLENAPEGMPLGELLRRVSVDFDATGQGYIEVVPSPVDRRPKTLAHMPAHTVRRHRDFHRYAQIRGNRVRWFKAIGFDQDVHLVKGTLHPLGSLPHDERASEVIHLMAYSSRSDYYGIPDAFPALGAMLGDLYSRDFNLKWFENHAIPAYAVTIIGAELDDDVERTIKDFFQNQVKKNPHSTLVLTASGGDPGRDIQFKFEKLAVEIRDASFRMYRQDNRNEVLTAHGVPPYRAGIAETGSLGQNVARETTEIYKDSVVTPRQAMVAWAITKHLLRGGLGITDWDFAFDEIDTTDEQQQGNVLRTYFWMGAYTPNQIRKMRGEEPSDDPAMDQYYIAGKPITGPAAQAPAGPDVSALLNSVKALHGELVEIIRKGSA